MARDGLTFADLVAIARRVGVQVVEAPSSHRGQLGRMGTVAGCTCHHTGTPNSYKPELDFPDFNVVKEGRAGLENTLSAYGLGRHTAIYVFSEFLSWHAGTWNWKGITDGNGHFLGIEAAGIGDWTPFQRAVYPRLVASILLFVREGVDMAPRHLDGAMPRGRKSDAAYFTFYDEIQWFMDHPEYINVNYQPKGNDDMAFIVKTQDDKGATLTAALIEGTFIGLVPGTDEEKNLADAGAKVWWITKATWDAYVSGEVLGLPQRAGAADKRIVELLEQIAQSQQAVHA